ncbi:MAG: hypothetical protein AB8B50_07070 [Pirellulaceae bacterium]
MSSPNRRSGLLLCQSWLLLGITLIVAESGLAIPTCPLLAQQTSQADTERTQLESSRVNGLLRDLSSADFAARENATRELILTGESHLPSLHAAKIDDLEGRRRLKRILLRLEAQRFDRISSNFLRDDPTTSEERLPSWEDFSSLVGDTRTSRLLFLDMCERQPQMMDLLSRNREASRTLHTGKEDVGSSEWQQEVVFTTAELAVRLRDRRQAQSQRPHIGDVLAVLYAASFIRGQTPIEVNEFLDTCAYSLPVASYIRRNGFDRVVKKLYANWIPKTHAAMSDQVLQLCLSEGYETGLPVARRSLRSSLSLRTRESALQLLARFGSQEDLPLVAEYLDDRTVCRRFAANQMYAFWQDIIVTNEAPPLGDQKPALDPKEMLELTCSYRICDLALATSLMLAEKDPSDSLPRFVTHPVFAYDVRGIATVNSDEEQQQREELLESWRKELKAILSE